MGGDSIVQDQKRGLQQVSSLPGGTARRFVRLVLQVASMGEVYEDGASSHGWTPKSPSSHAGEGGETMSWPHSCDMVVMPIVRVHQGLSLRRWMKYYSSSYSRYYGARGKGREGGGWVRMKAGRPLEDVPAVGPVRQQGCSDEQPDHDWHHSSITHAAWTSRCLGYGFALVAADFSKVAPSGATSQPS